MRLYALLSLALLCVLTRGATIPDIAGTPSETKIDSPSEDKTPVHEEEQLDQTNIINDVDNKLSLKPADIPVEVIAENIEPVLKTSAEKDESEEIVRPPIDLKNPGIPQRQEHDSQSHEIYAAEINLVESYKKNIIEAQAILKQGFQDVTDGIQNIFEKNERVKTIQQNIKSLGDSFVTQINKLDGTIQNYLSNENTNTNSPSEQQIKTNLEQLKTSLNTLKSEFTKRVNTIADGVEGYVALKAEASEGGNPPAATISFQEYLVALQQSLQNSLPSFPWTQGQQTPSGGTSPDAAQSDTEATAAPSPPWSFPAFPNIFGQGQQNVEQTQVGEFGSGSGSVINAIQNFWQSISGQPLQPANPATAPSESTQSESKPETQPADAKPETPTNQVDGTTLGPIRQILQNNPITQSIMNAVQNMQNIPPKIKEPEKEQPVKEKEKPVAEDEHPVEVDKLKGHRPGSGDNNDVNSGIKESEIAQEVTNGAEEQQPLQTVEKEMKTEQVVDKTESSP